MQTRAMGQQFSESDNPFRDGRRMTSQRIGKYACLEVEVRYLVSQMPDDLLDLSQGWLITDRYAPNLRLRLREMKALSGDERIYKLTQKYRTEDQNAYEATITNMYLSDAEFRYLESALQARVLKKRRYPYTWQNHALSIDVFEERHQGLVLAEMELEQKPIGDALALPFFAVQEVTADPFFAGGNLAVMTDAEFRQGLAQRIRDGREARTNS